MAQDMVQDMAQDMAQDMTFTYIGDFFVYQYFVEGDATLINASGKMVVDMIMADKAMELMQRHYEFYGAFLEEDSYVTSGSILFCSAGTKLSAFDLPFDHAVERSDGAAVGTCADCRENENICSFGYCSKPTPEGYPERTEIGFEDFVPREKCIPMLEAGWQTDSSEVLEIYDDRQGKYVDVLTTGAYLTCFYGGIIKVIETFKPYEYSRKYITLELLNNMGWRRIHCGYQSQEDGTISLLDDMETPIERRYRDITQEDIDEINSLFDRFEINTKKRICAFFAQCSAETGNGEKLLEQADKSIGEATRANLKKYFDEIAYTYTYRGGGVIHLTWYVNYDAFKSWMEDNFDVKDENILNLGTEYVATTYPWISGVFYWDYLNLNAYADNILDIDENDEIFSHLDNFDSINKLDSNQYDSLFKSIDALSKKVVGGGAKDDDLKPRRKYYVKWTRDFPEI